jgi:hypothetical protein
MSLLVVLLLVCVVGAALFIQAAFWGERDMAEQNRAVLMWRPSFIRGAALRDWAAAIAQGIAANRLAAPRTAKTAGVLAAELQDLAAHAMLPLARQAERERTVPCPECGQGMVFITAPEALAIADHIRKNLFRNERKRIHDLAVLNANKIAASKPGDLEKVPLCCPLLGQNQYCCVYAARPLRCRPLHAIYVARDMGSRAVQPAGQEGKAPEVERHEQNVEQGIEIGLNRALSCAGLDSKFYELNSALVAALDTPNAAERWAHGDNVFENCLASA